MSAVSMPLDARLATSPTPARVLRPAGWGIVYAVLSLGLWPYAWLHATLSEIGAATGRDLKATERTWLFLVPIVQFVVLYRVWEEIDAFVREHGDPGFSPGLYLALTFVPFGMLFTFPDVQMKLNAAWRARLGDDAERAPLGTFGGITLGLGVALVALMVLITAFFLLIAPVVLFTLS